MYWNGGLWWNGTQIGDTRVTARQTVK